MIRKASYELRDVCVCETCNLRSKPIDVGARRSPGLLARTRFSHWTPTSMRRSSRNL